MLVFNQNIQHACVVQNYITLTHSAERVPSYYHTVECHIHRGTVQSAKKHETGKREVTDLTSTGAQLGARALPSPPRAHFISAAFFGTMSILVPYVPSGYRKNSMRSGTLKCSMKTTHSPRKVIISIVFYCYYPR